MTYSTAVLINPEVKLMRGKTYPFVEMANVAPFTRNIPKITAREFTGNGSRFASGDTILARITPCLENGKIAQFREVEGNPGHGSTEFVVVRDRPGVTDNDFVYYLTTWDYVRLYAIQRMVGTSGRQRVPVSSFDHLIVSIPPMNEQRRIGSILSALDDKIELNRCMNQTLEAMAQALFKSWFVDFDPVRAKAEGRTPAGMDAETAALFPDSFEDSVLGEIPRGWTVSPIADFVEINGWSLASRDVLDAIDYIEISEVSRGNIGAIAQYQRGEEPSRARRRLRHGDSVLSTVRPDRRAYFLALHPPDDLVVSTGFAVLTPRTAPWSFVHAAMTQSQVFDYLGRHADGGAYPAVSAELIGAWQVAMPSRSGVFDSFHAVCAALYGRAECNRREARLLAAIRDALLPKLLSGEIRVKEAEMMAGAAL